MAECHADHSLFAECLAAMAAGGDAFPCDMLAHLAASDPFFLGQAPTIADVALHPRTAYAPEGHVPLAPYPQIRDWIRRIEALPGIVPMLRSQPKFGGPTAQKP